MQHRDDLHTLTVQEAFEALGSSRDGISMAEAERRLAELGPNEIEKRAKTSVWAILWAQIVNPLVAVLVLAAIISIVADHAADAIVIAVVIAVNTAIGFFQEYKAEEAIEALRSQAAPEAEVVRECPDTRRCTEITIKASEVVPGDVILLTAGDRVPADARVIEARNLEADEAMLTGESLPVSKIVEPLGADVPTAERRNLLYGGTIITHGRGRALVHATGSRTEMGKIAHLIQETEKAESPLQRETLNLGKKLSFFAFAMSAVTFLVGLLRGFGFQNMFTLALASAVSAIPEGLPAVMTITLAVGVNRMAKRNAIIRRLRAVDTLGAATIICTDKTGTLTTNAMTVEQMRLADRAIHVSGAGFVPEGEFRENGSVLDPAQDEALKLALTIGALCSDARLTRHESHDHRWEIHGDPTEGALVVAAAKANLPKEVLEEDYPRLDEIPFSTERGFMATFHQVGDQTQVLVKGAPERVLELCADAGWNGSIRPLDEEVRARVLRDNEEMAAAALRVLGLAHQTIAPEELGRVKSELENGRGQLTLVGLTGMIDPARPEVPEAVAQCKRAGIRVIMATGDHRLTGQTIAQQIGILEAGQRVLTGAEVEEMSDEALDAAIEDTAVFARVSPAHKHRIVESLRRRGHVVAMTGDGVNDAPALQAAEIGIAMGITGTDVTKGTADMVLTDDNFASIVSAIEEGRAVFQNVRKVVKYLLATNVGEILTIIASLLLFPVGKVLITPIQILWVNLVTDGILDITLAMEPKEGDVMEMPPRHRHEAIITREMVFNIIFVALFMAIGTLWSFGRLNSTRSLTYAQTIAFTTMAMFQVFNSLNCRSRTSSVFKLGLFTNKYLIGAIVVSVLLQIAANRAPLLQRMLGTEPLDLSAWGIIVAVSSSVFIADEIRKFVRGRIVARRRA